MSYYRLKTSKDTIIFGKYYIIESFNNQNDDILRRWVRRSGEHRFIEAVESINGKCDPGDLEAKSAMATTYESADRSFNALHIYDCSFVVARRDNKKPIRTLRVEKFDTIPRFLKGEL